MQNSIPTLYILELDSFVAKRAKTSTILRHLSKKLKKNIDRIAMRNMTQPNEPAFNVDIIHNTSC